MISRLRPRGSADRLLAWPELGLAVSRSSGLVEHFTAEYGAPDASGSDAAGLVITSLADMPATPSTAPPDAPDADVVRTAAHKTTRWRTRLGPASADPIRCGIEIRGLFGRSLVQSVVVEPLISVALARRGAASISAAGVVVEGRALAIAGISRSGKSSLALRAWGGGLDLLGDDRLIVTADGLVTGFPRRVRVYPDLAVTAPIAHERLGPGVRRQLAALGIIRRLTAGWVALPALVDANAVAAGRRSASLDRIVVIDRTNRKRVNDLETTADRASIAEADEPDAVWRQLDAIVERDLTWVASNGRDWAAAAADTRMTQLDILRRAVESTGAQLSIVTVPADWPAARAIATIARHLGLER